MCYSDYRSGLFSFYRLTFLAAPAVAPLKALEKLFLFGEVFGPPTNPEFSPSFIVLWAEMRETTEPRGFLKWLLLCVIDYGAYCFVLYVLAATDS